MLSSEEALRASGIAWTTLRPCAFMSNALRWIPQLRAHEVIRVPFGDVATAAIDPYDIAASPRSRSPRTGITAGRTASPAPNRCSPPIRFGCRGATCGSNRNPANGLTPR
jgi:hypothetical protein